MGLIFDALFKHKSHYLATLPYNLNWRRRNWTGVAALLKDDPIRVLDIGARGGVPEEIAPLARFIDYVGFDADAQEAARLNAAGNPSFAKFRVIGAFVGAKEGPVIFNLYRKAGESSALEPGRDGSAFFPELQIDRAITVESTTLDVLKRKGVIDGADFLKLDTQGTEFDILANGRETLSHSLMIEAEVEFIEMYETQKLFHDVCGMLYAEGFQLVYLNRVFMTRRNYQGPSRGQLVFGDALFALREDRAAQLPPARKIKYIVLLMQYGLMDFAYSLYVGDPVVQTMAPALAKEFTLWKGAGSALLRAALITFDKLIMLALHWRGTNQLLMDSDRSWPTR